MPVLLAILLAAAGISQAGSGDPPPITFVRHDVGSQNPGILSEGFTVGDVDGDGRIDMLDGGQNALLWYRNPDWQAFPIATGFRYSAGAAIEVEDVDGDGRNDVVTGRYPLDQPSARQMLWLANTPGGWVEHVLSSTAFCHDLAFGDVDGDGHEDAICCDQFRDEVVALYASADPTLPWTSVVVDSGRRPMGAAIADFDGDGRLDVVAGRTFFHNEGGRTWSRHPLTTASNPADPRFDDQSEDDVLDVDGDGRLDVIATLFGDSREGRLYAFLAPPDPVNEAWTPVEIDPGPLWGIHSQGTGSFDGSARVQVMIGEPTAAGFGFGLNPSPEIYVYRLLGPATDPASWERTLVDTVGTLEAEVVDIDGDGRPDIAGHDGALDGSTPGRLSWWQNTTVQAVTPTTSPPATTTTLPEGCTSPGCRCRVGAVPACAVDPVPAGVRRRLGRACAMIARAEERAMERPMRKAGRLVEGLVRRALRAEKRGRLAPGCADALAALETALGGVRPPGS